MSSWAEKKQLTSHMCILYDCVVIVINYFIHYLTMFEALYSCFITMLLEFVICYNT